MALSSSTGSKSIAELSESPLYHYQFSSLYKTIEHLPSPDDGDDDCSLLIKHALSFLERRPRYLLQLDTTPSERTHSKTLPERGYVKIPNQVVTHNTPVTVGYNLSLLNVQALEDSKWSLPVNIKRLGITQNAKEVGVAQLQALLSNEDLPFKKASFVINTADSHYQHPSFIAPLYNQANLVNIIRLSKGQKVYKLAHRTKTGGRDAYKGHKAYLLPMSVKRQSGNTYYEANSIFDSFQIDDYQEFDEQTYKGREIKIYCWRFNDLLLETKKGHNMLNKPIDVVVSMVYDAQTGKAVFKQPMYIAMTNPKRREISTKEAFEAYRHRYDIEPSIRFSKQALKLDKYKTCDIDHYDKWFLVYQLAYWLLFAASNEADYQAAKWRSYKPVNKTENIKGHLSPSQTFRAAESLLLKIDPTPFKPRSSNKGKGRKKGTVLKKRNTFNVVKKGKKLSNIDTKDRKNE